VNAVNSLKARGSQRLAANITFVNGIEEADSNNSEIDLTDEETYIVSAEPGNQPK